MKIIDKSVDMIAVFDKEGNIKPWKFKIQSGEEEVFIKVDRTTSTDIAKVAGETYISYRCQSVIRNTERVFELRYNIKRLQWILYKI